MNYSAINIQGNIISLEILDKIRNEENYPHQKPKDFGFEKGTSIRDKIGNAWSEAKILWELYSRKMERLPEGDYGTTETRKLWMTPFLFELGYDIEIARAKEINGKSFPISHRDAKRYGFPVLIMGYQDKIDRKPEGARLRMSPHALMQEYLNHTEHLYGLVINGTHIRLLRDSNRLSKLAYLEFDIGKMLEEDLFYEFAIMYRVIHASRMPKNQDEIEKAVFEFYHQESIDSGARIREKLRSAVKESMELLAKGFLFHTENEVFVEKVRNREIKAEQFYKILLRTIYRIIFLATIEERSLVYEKSGKNDPDFEKKNRLRNIYLNYYSFERLRNLALSPVYIDPRRQDLWQSLLATFRLFEPLGEGEKLGIKPLGGELFGNHSLQLDGVDFYELRLHNSFMLEILGRLTTFRDERKQLTRVNYRDLDVEELGSVYEALLELQPYFNLEATTPVFSFTPGSERKFTSSFYTRHDLVAQLIKTALIPVMEERIKKARLPEEKEKALLDIKVCDSAAGSGHFLLAASRVMGYELAKIRSGEENPGEDWVLPATRDVIEQCIYGVDNNPAAVELCRLSLWLVGHNNGKSLTFLEHKIKCGDSMVGVDNMERLINGIPDGAYKTTTGDDPGTASEAKKINREFRKSKQFSVFGQSGKLDEHQKTFAEKYRQLTALQINSVEDYENKRRQYNQIVYNPQLQKDMTACNLFTYAFFQKYEIDKSFSRVITSEMLANFLGSLGSTNATVEGEANAKAMEYRFFHWPLEFPDVFEKGGFDVVLGNPPWDRIKLQEKEFFATRDTNIADAANKAARTKLITKLPDTNPELNDEYLQALHFSEASSKFVRESGRFPLTGRGDVNTYSIFSEISTRNLNEKGRAGILVPTGIATDDTNKFFFAEQIENNRLISLYDFENRKKLFPDVDSRYKFSMLTITGKNLPVSEKPTFAFFLHDVLDLQDSKRVFELSKQDFLNINPNTKTTPIFRTRQDAELTANVYSYVPVVKNVLKMQNPWEIDFSSMFHMSNFASAFRTKDDFSSSEFSFKGNRFINQNADSENEYEKLSLPLYESKMIWHFDHKFGSYEGVESRLSTHIPTPNLEKYQDQKYLIQPWYWIDYIELENILTETDIKGDRKWIWEYKWFLSFRDITNNTNERTGIFTIIPFQGVGNNLPVVFPSKTAPSILLLESNFNALSVDYLTRQKIAGTHMNFYYVEQLAILPFSAYPKNCLKEIISSALELNYSTFDIKAFADDVWKEADKDLRRAILQQWQKCKASTGGHTWLLPEWKDAYPEIHWHSPMEQPGWSEEDLLNYEGGCPLPPFKWDEDRRARLKAELDAYYALLYGLNRDELRYILDPQDVYGPDFPGETFRVLKEKETKKYGEYRTRRLVLEAYDKLAPSWDMEAHLKRLKEVWEGYQVDLSKGKDKEQRSKTKKTSGKNKEDREEMKKILGQWGLFDEEEE